MVAARGTESPCFEVASDDKATGHVLHLSEGVQPRENLAALSDEMATDQLALPPLADKYAVRTFLERQKYRLELKEQ